VKVTGSASRTLFLSLNRHLGLLRQTATNGSDVNDEEHVLPVLAAGVHAPNSRADDALPIYLRRSVVDWVCKHDVMDPLFFFFGVLVYCAGAVMLMLHITIYERRVDGPPCPGVCL
jgi:hypothetical protein